MRLWPYNELDRAATVATVLYCGGLAAVGAWAVHDTGDWGVAGLCAVLGLFGAGMLAVVRSV